jgi:hypothetical protein
MYRNSLTDNCVYKVYLTINYFTMFQVYKNNDNPCLHDKYSLRSYLFMKTGIIMFLHILSWLFPLLVPINFSSTLPPHFYFHNVSVFGFLSLLTHLIVAWRVQIYLLMSLIYFLELLSCRQKLFRSFYSNRFNFNFGYVPPFPQIWKRFLF